MCFEFTKNKKLALTIASVLFGLVAVVHLIRLFTHFSIVINGQELSLPVSVIGLLITGGMSAWLWMLR